MKTSVALIASLSVVALMGCTTYESFVKTEMKIPNVFLPPSNGFEPYSIVAYSESFNFQPVCSAAQLVKSIMPMDQFVRTYLEEDKGRDVGSEGIRESGNYSVDVTLLPEEIGAIEVGHSGTYSVTMKFTNGKVFTVNDEALNSGTLLMAMLTTPGCRASLIAFASDPTKKQFMMVNNLFRYDTEVSINKTNSTNIAADLPTPLKNLLLKKASAKFGGELAITKSAPKMYVGFRGLEQELPTELKEIAKSPDKPLDIVKLKIIADEIAANAQREQQQAVAATKVAEEIRQVANAKAEQEAKAAANAKSTAEAIATGEARAAADAQVKEAARIAESAKANETLKTDEAVMLANAASVAATDAQQAMKAVASAVTATSSNSMPANGTGPAPVAKAIDVMVYIKVANLRYSSILAVSEKPLVHQPAAHDLVGLGLPSGLRRIETVSSRKA